MNSAQQILWDSAKEYLYITPEEWLAPVAHWEFGTSERHGEITGAYMISPQGEIHIAVVKQGYAITRRQFREILSRYGRLTTRTPKWMDTGVALRLGFTKVGEDELDNFYQIEGESRCQQSQ